MGEDLSAISDDSSFISGDENLSLGSLQSLEISFWFWVTRDVEQEVDMCSSNVGEGVLEKEELLGEGICGGVDIWDDPLRRWA